MTHQRIKDDDPCTDIKKTWTDDEAKKLSQLLWTDEKWTANVYLIELMGDGEYVINADPFSKTCSKYKKGDDTMPMKDKLIRDKIPQIIESQRKRCGVDEFMWSDEIDELVEAYEVILTMLDLKGMTVEEL